MSSIKQYIHFKNESQKLHHGMGNSENRGGHGCHVNLMFSCRSPWTPTEPKKEPQGSKSGIVSNLFRDHETHSLHFYALSNSTCMTCARYPISQSAPSGKIGDLQIPHPGPLIKIFAHLNQGRQHSWILISNKSSPINRIPLSTSFSTSTLNSTCKASAGYLILKKAV